MARQWVLAEAKVGWFWLGKTQKKRAPIAVFAENKCLTNWGIFNMTTSLYDLSVASYKQSLDAVAGYLAKGATHAADNNIDLGSIVDTQLYPDMRPFSFQMHSVVHHSMGAIEGMRTGEFGPPANLAELDYVGFQDLIAQTRSSLEALTSDAINELAGKTVVFKIGETELPFTAENFVLSFSLPNLYFHATTGYDILRMQGVSIGKRDYMGTPRVGT